MVVAWLRPVRRRSRSSCSFHQMEIFEELKILTPSSTILVTRSTEMPTAPRSRASTSSCANNEPTSPPRTQGTKRHARSEITSRSERLRKRRHAEPDSTRTLRTPAGSYLGSSSPKSAFSDVLSQKDLGGFARHGGPDLSDLRGYGMPDGVRKSSSSRSATSRSRLISGLMLHVSTPSLNQHSDTCRVRFLSHSN